MASSPTIDLDREIHLLEVRKVKLAELLELQEEVAGLELKLLIGTDLTTPRLITEVVCEHYNLSRGAITCESREGRLVEARHIIFYLTKNITTAAVTKIGRLFRRNHGTVVNALKNVSNRMETERAFKDLVEALRAKCIKRLEQENKP